MSRLGFESGLKLGLYLGGGLMLVATVGAFLLGTLFA